MDTSQNQAAAAAATPAQSAAPLAHPAANTENLRAPIVASHTRTPRVADGTRARALANGDILSADTAMGPVTLLVGDLDAVTRYYREGVGLSVLTETADSRTLGRGSTPVMILKHAPELMLPRPGGAGLFHTAILFDSEAALAAAVYSVASHFPNLYSGSADHLVSKAFYFADPEGNGVELYWDRPRDQWTWIANQVSMDTLPLDPNEYIATHLTQSGIDAPGEVGAAKVGHVHLAVGDVKTAKEFYVDALGFEQTATFGPQALFVSAGGYHHHMAMNTWNSRGAARRPATLGLGNVVIDVPTEDDVDAVRDRLRHAGVATRSDGEVVTFDDPWANSITVRTV